MKTVSLYIYVDELIDDVLTPIGHKLELFGDESISITSSIQNFRDLGKVFTDYSKAFTIPASNHNNKILQHWYNSEVGETSLDNPINVDGAFDHRISYYGFIEIDTVPFRYGKFLLKGSKKVNNKIESYTIEFIGNLVQLKERFKDDKLNSLSTIVDGVRVSLYKQLNHAWNLMQVKDRVVGGTQDVLYPLIGTKRKLYLDSGVPAQDISHNTGKLKFDEIFPALRVTKILEYIQTAYGITFDGAFINSQTFSKLYLYLKNQDKLAIKSEQLMIDFDSKQGYTQVYGSPIGGSSNRYDYEFDDLNLDTNVLTFDLDYAPFFSPFTSLPQTWRYRELKLTVTTTSSNPYNLYVYNNGVLYSTFENIVGTSTKTIFARKAFGATANPDDFTIYNFSFFISSEAGITFETTVEQSISVMSSNTYTGIGGAITFPTQTQVSRAYSSSQTTVSNIDIQSFIPDITVEAFITGLIKMFNLMVIPTSESSFYLQPLNEYYNDGIVWDLTKYVIADDMSIDAPQLYKKVEFKYQKSPNILNEAFRGLFNKEYGDLNFENKNSAFAETYTVELPFEDFMFERETGTNFLTATIFDKDQKPYIPKPSFVYCNGVQSITPDIKVADNTTTYDINQYTRFSNELALAGSDLAYTQSLNWGAEISSWDLNVNFVGLYQKFYSSYIENLFNQRTRVIKFKAILPNSVLCFIKLKDKIVISNKRYIINTMTPELTSGETTFELIQDSNYLTSTNTTPVLRLSNFSTLQVDNTAQEIEVQAYLKDFDSWQSKGATSFLIGTYYSARVYKDGLMTVSIPANTSGVERNDAILLEFRKNGSSTVYSIPVTQNA